MRAGLSSGRLFRCCACTANLLTARCGNSAATTARLINAELKFDRIRYRLLPYIYSLAGGVTQDGGTMMRALVMDFPADTNVFNIGDEYLFGPALLVSPVTTYQARTRPVYLPATCRWLVRFLDRPMAGGCAND